MMTTLLRGLAGTVLVALTAGRLAACSGDDASSPSSAAGSGSSDRTTATTGGGPSTTDSTTIATTTGGNTTTGGMGGAGGGGTTGTGGTGPVDPGQFLGMPRCMGAGFWICDDFEGASIDAGTWEVNAAGGTLMLDTTRAARGQKSLHGHIAGDVGSALVVPTAQFPAGKRQLWGRMLGYIPSSAKDSLDGHSNITALRAPNSTKRAAAYAIAVRGGTFLGLFYEDGTADLASSLEPGNENLPDTVIPLDRWFCLEWLFDGDSNSLHGYLDGVEMARVAMRNHPAPIFWDVPPSQYDISVGTEFSIKDLWMDSIALHTSRIGCAN
jgi:hypothetical protein